MRDYSDCVSGIRDMQDELERLRRRVAELEAFEGYRNEFRRIGRREVWERSYCYAVGVELDGDGTPDTFEDWKEKHLFGVPDFLSFHDFCRIYDGELHEVYVEAVKKALGEKSARGCGNE